MIVSKPHSRALFAMGVFLILCFSLSFYGLRNILSGAFQWYNFLIVLFVLPIALIIMIRQLVNFKIITVGNNEIKVGHPFIFKGYKINIRELESWDETIIITKNGKFRELKIRSPYQILTLSIQENTNYLQIYDYLKKKVGSKREKN